MKTCFLFLGLTLSFSLCGFSQTDFEVSGKVTDDSNHLALSKASIFCMNTTFGTVSDNDGNFSLRLPKGGYDLVISYTGFESQTLHISNNNPDNKNLKVELKLRNNSMEEVAVVASTAVRDGLAKYGPFFMENFIGSTANAANCKILNPEAMKFYYNKKRNRLKVMSKEELQIENSALGYKIRYQLDSFTYEYASNISTYSGSPLFEEMTGTPEQTAVWKLNRKKAYQGSRLHFIRSWYSSTLADQGYRLEKVDTTIKILTTAPLENPYDTSIFRKVDNNEVEIAYVGRLRVLYDKEMPDPKFVSLMKLPSQVRVQISVLDIYEPFSIEENGYFYDQADVTNTGYWSWEKIADLVPYNYQVE